MTLLDRSPGAFFAAANALVYTFIVVEALLIAVLPDSVGVALAATGGVLVASATCTAFLVRSMFRLLEAGGAADEHTPAPAPAREAAAVTKPRRARRPLVARPVH
jgi:hypothetical protein